MATELLSLFAKIGIDDKEYNKGIQGAESKASKFGEGVKKAGKVAIAGFTAVAGAVTAIGTKAVQSYADYEQLVGGTELMFGKAYDFVMQKSKEAYKNVQMSQNEYLQQVNGFATGLKTSLGGNEQAAAELADKIVTAEADIVAATGNTQENVQNAFNGIMKSNYTMLDNLQIGIKPTKEGFQEVIDKVNEHKKAIGDTTRYSIDNLADAQSALVDYIDMVGMSGYAQKESSKTIQGSLASMKGAWENLLTGIADDNQDFDALMDNLVDSVVTFGKNIIPRVETALGGVGKLVQGLGEKVLPMLIEQLPIILESLLPAVMSTIDTLLNSVVKALPSVINILLNIIPQLLYIGLQLILALANGITDSLPTLIPALVNVIDQIVEKLTAPDTLTQLIMTAFTLILALSDGLVDAIPQLIKAMPTIISNIVSALIKLAPQLLKASVKLISTLAIGFVQSVGAVRKAIGTINDKIKEKFGEIKDKAKTWGKDLLQNFIDGIKAKIKALKDKVTDVANTIKSRIHFSVPDEGPLADADTYMPDMIDLFTKGIDQNKYKLVNSVQGLAGSIDNSFGYDGYYQYGNTGNGNSTQEFIFTIDDKSNAPLLQIVRLLFPYIKIVEKEKGERVIA